MGLTTKEISSSSFNDMISSVDRRSEYVENRAGANVRLNNFLTPYTLDDKSSILNAPCGYSNGVYPSLRPVQTFGSELITNGDFATDSDWTKGSNWSINNGVATYTPSGFSNFSQSNIGLEVGKTYKLTVTLIGGNSGTVCRFYFGGSSSTTYSLVNGKNTIIGIAVTDKISFRNLQQSDFSIDNVSVKEVIDADFDFTRGSAATRVTKDGLVKNVQILSDELVQNGDFSEIGSEEVINGGFDTDSNWSKDSNWSISNGSASADGTSNNNISQSSVIPTVGKTYKITFEVLTISQGYFQARLGNELGVQANNVGVYTSYVKATTNDRIRIYGKSLAIGSIDNVSVKEVGQNWAFGTGWSMGDGVAISNGSGSYLTDSVSNGFTSGKKYRVSLEIVEYNSGRVSLPFDGAGGNINYQNSVGVKTADITAENNSPIYIYSNNFDGSIDNISVIEITDDTDLPRIDYTDGEGSLLLEPQSTNLVTYSEGFSQWNSNSEVLIESGYVAPDGSNNAVKITSIGSGSYFALSGLSLTGTDTRTIYARTVSGSGTVNLCSYGQNTNNNFTITEQWQRFEVNSTTTATGETNFYGADFRFPAANSLTEVIIWGAQAEALSYATSYIPTEGSIKTRLADICNNAGSSDLINSTEGVLYAEISALANDGTFRQLTISDSSTSDRISIDFTSTSNQIRSFCSSGGSTVANMTGTVTDVKQFNKIAVKYKLNDYALWINGVEVATDTSASAPTGLKELAFDNSAGSNNFKGNVKCVAVFKEALTDEELAKITSTTQQEAFYEMRDKMLQIDADYYEFGDYTTRLKKLF